MFTGIIQSKGLINSKTFNGDSIKFSIKPEDLNFLKNVYTGDSISVNGACMTVESKSKYDFKFTTIKESIRKTNLSLLKLNNLVNLEKAMTLSSKLDGHLVQGHIDCTGIIKKINKLTDSWEYFVDFNSKFAGNIIEVGSISINGVSLTIAEIVKENTSKVLIKVSIIPHTYENTTFNSLIEKDIVNIEFDMIGKYIQRNFKNKKPADK